MLGAISEGGSLGFVDIAKRGVVAAIFCLILAPDFAHAQVQRSIINESFEENDPQGPGAPNYEIFSDAAIPGWNSTEGRIELWDSGFLGVPAYDGAVFAEMNENTNLYLYQNVCMVNGEQFSWQFAHRKRADGPAVQNAQFNIETQAGTLVQQITTSATSDSNNWLLRSGTGTSFTGPSGVYRIGFRTTDPGTLGNLLDNVKIGLTPYVEGAASTTSSLEGSLSPVAPSL